MRVPLAVHHHWLKGRTCEHICAHTESGYFAIRLSDLILLLRWNPCFLRKSWLELKGQGSRDLRVLLMCDPIPGVEESLFFSWPLFSIGHITLRSYTTFRYYECCRGPGAWVMWSMCHEARYAFICITHRGAYMHTKFEHLWCLQEEFQLCCSYFLLDYYLGSFLIEIPVLDWI